MRNPFENEDKLMKILEGKPVYLSGSYVLSEYLRDTGSTSFEPNDIDLFFSGTYKQYNKLIEEISKYYDVENDSKNEFSFVKSIFIDKKQSNKLYVPQIKVQIIFSRKSKINGHDILPFGPKQFDFKNLQIISKYPFIEYSNIPKLKNFKELKINENNITPMTFERLQKYVKRGFKINHKEVTKIFEFYKRKVTNYYTDFIYFNSYTVLTDNIFEIAEELYKQLNTKQRKEFLFVFEIYLKTLKKGMLKQLHRFYKQYINNQNYNKKLTSIYEKLYPKMCI